MGFIYQNTPIYRCENSPGLHWTNRTSCLGRLVPWSRWPIKVSTKCLGTPSHCPQNHHQKTVWQTKILKIGSQWWSLRTATKFLQRLHLNLNFHSAKPRWHPHWPLGGDRGQWALWAGHGSAAPVWSGSAPAPGQQQTQPSISPHLTFWID